MRTYYSATIEVEVSVGIGFDNVLECTVPIECEFWCEGDNDPQTQDESSAFLIEKSFCEPDWFHVRIRDCAIEQAKTEFFNNLDKYEN